MTVGELIEKLNNFDTSLEVCGWDSESGFIELEEYRVKLLKINIPHLMGGREFVAIG